jgi:hypothetical protein
MLLQPEARAWMSINHANYDTVNFPNIYLGANEPWQDGAAVAPCCAPPPSRSARFGSARLGSARLGSARLGSARLGGGARMF